MKFFKYLFIFFVTIQNAHAQGTPELLKCSGSLNLLDNARHLRVLIGELSLRPQQSFRITVVDANGREILKFWPWGTVQTKILLNKIEEQKRNLVLKTNGIDWLDLEIDSTSSKSRDALHCEVEGR